MTQKVIAACQIGGQNLPAASQIRIRQGMDNLHAFDWVISNSEVRPFVKDDLLKSARDWQGKTVKITFGKETSDGAENTFLGIATAVAIRRNPSSGENELRLSGFGAVALLDTAPLCKSFLKQNLAAIAQSLCSTAGGQLQTQISPNFSSSIAFASQFRSTPLAYLSQLAARFGEWCFFDGEVFHFGKRKAVGGGIRLVLGDQLQQLEIGLVAAPVQFKTEVFQVEQNQVFKTSSAASSNWGDLIETAASRGEQIFPKSNAAALAPPLPFSTQQEADQFSKQQQLTRLSSLAPLSGTTTDCRLRPGAVVSIEQRADLDGKQSSALGDFVVVQCQHFVGGDGSYQCSFAAVPASAPAQPIFFKNFEKTPAPPQLAEVTANDDPQSLGRLRVRFDWMSASEETPWLPFAAPYAGEQRGLHFLPEVGDRAWVAFAENDPDAPFVVGSVHHEAAKTPVKDPKNRLKTLRTIGDNEVLFDDTEGKQRIIIRQKEGKNEIMLDFAGAGAVRIFSKGKIQIESKDIHLAAKEEMTFEAKKIKMKAQNVRIETEASYEVQAGSEGKLNAPVLKLNCS